MSISGTTVEAIRALEDEYAEAMSRLHTVGNDLTRLRRHLSEQAEGATPAPAAARAPTLPQVAPTPPHPSVASTQAAPPAGWVTPPPPHPRPGVPAGPGTSAAGASSTPWWRRRGLSTVLAAVGAGITLIGVALLIAFAIQLGWLGPAARVVAGGVLAVALLAAGLLVARRQERVTGAVGLVATGLATAYLDIVAVTRIDDWLPQAVGLALAGAVVGGGLLLARHWGSQALATITVLGAALLAPVVGWPHGHLVGAFMLVLSIATWPAGLGHRWLILDIARVAPTAVVLAGVHLFDWESLPATAMSLTFVLFTLGTAFVPAATATSAARQTHDVLISLAALPSLLAMLLSPHWSSLGVGIVLLLALAVATARLRTPLVTLLAVPVSFLTTSFAAGHVVPSSLGSDLDGLTITLTAIAWMVLATVVRQTWVTTGAGLTTIAAALSLADVLPFVLQVTQAGELDPSTVLHALSATALAAVVTLALRRGLLPLPAVTMRTGVRAGAAATVVLAGLSVVLVLTLLGGWLDQPETGFRIGHAVTTVGWLGLAAVLLTLGLRRGSGATVTAALVLTACCVGKLVAFDLSSLGGLVRVLGFLGGGVLLLVMGVLAAQDGRRPSGPVDNPAAGSPAAPNVEASGRPTR